jgi:uncharacterized protein YggE
MNESWKETFITLSKPIRTTVVVVLATLALFLLAQTWHTITEIRNIYAPGNITVKGIGKASVAPNIAHISFTVQEKAATVSEAQKTATEKTNTALETIKAAEILDKDVTTTGYNVNPEYEVVAPCFGGDCLQAQPKIIGYQVSQSVEAKVRDIEKAGELLQKLGYLNIQNISGPNFMVDDDAEVVAQARGKAIEDAQAKADVLAKQLGVSLGKVIGFCDNCGDFQLPEPQFSKSGMMDMMRSSAISNEVAPNLPQGEQMTVRTVEIIYEIR